ncbi:MAG: MBL fold metallo-hydrolase [Planctomycetes bacterium]|nr:MBL fold metallo-hydrolase [Planctomycetota bacterium]
MNFGDFHLASLSDGVFRLDGGAMFGIVPKPLWKKRAPPDRLNRITLGLRPLLIRTGTKNILVDTGIGAKDDLKFRRMFAVRQQEHLTASLAAEGLAPQDVDLVILTHLHFDHTGGSTLPGPDGSAIPAFPRARYVVQRGEWEDALHPTERSRASYLPPNFLPLQERGLVDFVEGDVEVAPGVRVLVTGGHTRHHQAVLVESAGRKAIYFGDLIPTTAHVDLPYIMGYDLDPLQTLLKKKELVPRAAQEGWLCFFEHDAARPAGFIRYEGKRATLEPWAPGAAEGACAVPPAVQPPAGGR